MVAFPKGFLYIVPLDFPLFAFCVCLVLSFLQGFCQDLLLDFAVGLVGLVVAVM